MIERLVAALDELGLDPTGEDVQDALWLALRAGVFDEAVWRRPPGQMPATVARDRPPRGPDDHRPAGERPAAVPPVRTSPIRTPESETRRPQATPSAGVYPRVAAAPDVPGVAVRVPGTSALPGALPIARALRPLRRRVPSRFVEVVDEEATSQRTAQTRVWSPVMRPVPSRWLDLALVVDGGPSMAIWRDTVTELQRLLERQGAFRDVRTWTLSTQGHPSGPVRLHRRSGRAGVGPARDPDELVDPNGRRLILILTDGISPAWRQDALRGTVGRWCRAGPVGIGQLLPERLWSRVTLRTVTAKLRAPRAGAPSARLTVSPSVGRAEKRQLPVPVLELSPEWLKPWSTLVAGAADTWRPGAVSFFGERDQGQPERPSALFAPRSGSAQERVERFRAAATPTAYRLASLLAAVYLTVPIMHLVQRVMLPESGLDHLAEVFLSGLVVQLPPRGLNGEEGEVEYDFEEGVRELLLNGILRSEASLVLRKVGAYIEERDPDTHGINAFLADPSGSGRLVISGQSGPFATVAAQVLRRLDDEVAAKALDKAAREEPDGVEGSEDPPEVSTAAAPGTVRIGLLGATNSGKSTFLAALRIAAVRDQSAGSWTIFGNDDESNDFLSESFDQLWRQRAFPAAGLQGIPTLSWRFVGDLTGTALAQRRRGRRNANQVEFTLELQDPPGTYFLLGAGTSGPRSQDTARVIEHLVASEGLVYLFDPIRELESGDSFRFFGDIMNMVAQRWRERTGSRNPRLPHHLAVCVTKFDDPEIFERARRAGWVSWDTTGVGSPRVPDNRAAAFFEWICQQRPDGSANAVRNLIGRYFHSSRVVHFVSSAVGFYAPRGGRVDPERYSNVEAGERIRGEVRPINVLEPFVWLERQIRAPVER